MTQVKKEKTTGDLPLLPYSAMVTSCCLWMTYGILSDMNWTIIAPNMTGLLFGAYYVSVFQKYKAPSVSLLPHYLGAGSIISAVGGKSTYALHALTARGGWSYVSLRLM